MTQGKAKECYKWSNQGSTPSLLMESWPFWSPREELGVKPPILLIGLVQWWFQLLFERHILLLTSDIQKVALVNGKSLHLNWKENSFCLKGHELEPFLLISVLFKVYAEWDICHNIYFLPWPRVQGYTRLHGKESQRGFYAVLAFNNEPSKTYFSVTDQNQIVALVQ